MTPASVFHGLRCLGKSLDHDFKKGMAEATPGTAKWETGDGRGNPRDSQVGNGMVDNSRDS